MNKEAFTVTEEKGAQGSGFSRFIVEGRVTAVNANILEYKLKEAYDSGRKRMIVNMRKVPFLGSGGIRVLLMFYKKAKKEGGSFHIESPSDNVVGVLGMTALDDLLKF
jgi:anti-anti-sigma factor